MWIQRAGGIALLDPPAGEELRDAVAGAALIGTLDEGDPVPAEIIMGDAALPEAVTFAESWVLVEDTLTLPPEPPEPAPTVKCPEPCPPLVLAPPPTLTDPPCPPPAFPLVPVDTDTPELPLLDTLVPVDTDTPPAEPVLAVALPPTAIAEPPLPPVASPEPADTPA